MRNQDKNMAYRVFCTMPANLQWISFLGGIGIFVENELN